MAQPKRVVLSAKLPSAARQVLAAAPLDPPLLVDEPASGRYAPEELQKKLADADALLTPLVLRVDSALLEAAPHLRVVANFAVGLDNIDLAAATSRGVIVTHTPEVLTAATADLAMALLLGSARRFVEGMALVSSGAWVGLEPEQLLGADVEGATLGIIGFGRIGRAVAQRARSFGMRIVYAAPRPAPPEIERALDATHLTVDELLATSDFVSLHLPLSPQTHHLIDAAALARMKRGAILINTARGPIVDEDALCAALASGHLRAVGLDVHEHEPRVHPALRASPHALLLPHLGSATEKVRARMARMAAESIVDVLSGRRPAHVANPAVYQQSTSTAPPART